MTTKELINQYVTAHSDNRWMDASELETLLTEFAEKLKEPASEDLAIVVREQMEYDGEIIDKGEFIKFADGKYIDLNPTMGAEPLVKLEEGDKVKVIIIKE